VNDKIKVILDTDIGSDIDDAVALAYLLSQPRCDLVGITTVSGQPELRAQMASAICRHVGRDDIPIHSGCPQAMLTDIRQKEAPQARALGDWKRQRDFEPLTAVDFLRRTIRANPGEIVLLTIGPLTNIGVLFALDPELPALLKGFVAMGGVFFERQQGEWNAVNDPYATKLAYGGGCQARPPMHTSFGLDVTLKCVLPADECRQKFTAKVLQPVRDFAEVWFKHAGGVCFHDPLAAACIFESDICRYKQGKVNVSVADPTLGWTILDERAEPKVHTVAHEVDAPRFFQHYFDVVK
jgi:inosine-uridine nucleoside N-ribohydrolase